MSAWLRLIIYESLGHLRSSAVRLLAATLIGLSLLAANVGIQQFAIERAQADHYQAEQVQAGETLLTGLQSGAALRVVRRPPPGTVLVRSGERSVPAYWESSPASLVEGPIGASIDQRSELGPLLDFEGVVRIVLGLMSLLIGIRAVAGHRQDHTLQTLLDLPLRRWSLALAKLLAASISLAVTLAVLAIGILLLIKIQAAELMSTELPAIVAISSGLALAYSAVLVAVGMAIGSFSRNMATAGSIGIGLWGFSTLAYPQIAMFSLHVVAPLPLRALTEGELQGMHASRYASTLELMGRSAGRLVAEASGDLKVLETPSARKAIDEVWQADSAETRYLLGVVEARSRSATARYERLFAWLAAPNPAMIFARTLGAVADTGSHAEARWRTALADYQHVLVTQHYDDPPRVTLPVPSEVAFQRILFNRKRVPRAADLPQFHPPVRDLGGRLYDARRDLALLAAFVLVTGLLAVACFPTSGT